MIQPPNFVDIKMMDFSLLTSTIIAKNKYGQGIAGKKAVVKIIESIEG